MYMTVVKQKKLRGLKNYYNKKKMGKGSIPPAGAAKTVAETQCPNAEMPFSFFALRKA